MMSQESKKALLLSLQVEKMKEGHSGHLCFGWDEKIKSSGRGAICLIFQDIEQT